MTALIPVQSPYIWPELKRLNEVQRNQLLPASPQQVTVATHPHPFTGPRVELEQIHSDRIYPWTQAASPKTQGDGLLVLYREFKSHKMDQINLAIKTADCLPVLLLGTEGLAFLHCGWKGLANGIIQNPSLQAIRPQTAIVGPAIGSCCYQVTEEFFIPFPHHRKNPIMESKKFFFSLFDEAKRQLMQRDVEVLNTTPPPCTFCRGEFHSFRRSGTKKRNWNVVTLKKLCHS